MADYYVDVDAAVFNDAYLPYIESDTRTQIFFGGASSGKSVFVAQRAVLDVAGGGRNYLVCRAVARTIRNSVFNEVRRVINSFGMQDLFAVNKSEFVITCLNGFQIVFVGLDDVEKLKSIVPEKGSWTDIWIEEATEISRFDLKNLSRRQRGGDYRVKKRMHLTFNPIYRHHWLYQEFFAPIGWGENQKQHKGERVSILKTIYKDNKFLTADDVKDLESETDKYFFDVYTLGKWGVLGNVIFTNWEYADLSGMREQFTSRRNGLDFGYSSDPAAILCSHYDRKHKTIYVFEELYERNLTNDVLAVAALKLLSRDLVVCDSAEPKSIAELQKHGVRAIGAKKGKDSVLFGIQWLQQQHIVVDNRCVNTGNELTVFKWREDKSGNALPEPVERDDHLIAAMRYAYEDESLGTAKELPDDQPTQSSLWIPEEQEKDLVGWHNKY